MLLHEMSKGSLLTLHLFLSLALKSGSRAASGRGPPYSTVGAAAEAASGLASWASLLFTMTAPAAGPSICQGGCRRVAP